MTGSSKTRKKSSPHSANNKTYYPAFLDIAGKKCVIAGGGKVAERKCTALIKAGAEVTVISPALSPRLEGYRKKGMITHLRRRYREGDARSAFAVFAATDSEIANCKVAADSVSSRALVNVADNPSLCSLIVPSVVKRGPLTFAVSTGGISPAMARAIRRELGALYGRDLVRYLRFLRDLRTRVAGEIQDKGVRGVLLKGLATPEILELLRRKGFAEARKAALGRRKKLCP
ncbi:MAG: bifunctional precorrin-2 dehydrogenase/sirohydrochlorin ferrochelatase [Nitrospirae bacterium]|nr:bifunctional precorrin-2 dehydrogenase/sirohydrochlorin ferrochelatase [Nitrospirota bacterium]